MSPRFENAMRRLAADSANAEPPREIERALLAEFDRASRRRKILAWTIPSMALAASILAVFFVARYPRPTAPAAAIPEAARESEQPFIPIPYVVQPGPYENASIVRMNLPVAALLAAGLPMQTPDPGAQVEADVLIGQDGRARAVRLISVSSFN